jgi:pimeloyl-ACP methyl ester carboxylesterase
VVGQSLGGLVAPLVADRCAADLLVLVCPMVPRPGETGGEWWQVTDQAGAARRFAVEEGRDPEDWTDETLYFHDVPDDVTREAMQRPVEQTDGPFRDPWPLDHWPDVPTRVVAGALDRLFPPAFVAALARERAGVEADLVEAGHLAALADPDALVDLLDRYAREVTPA